MEAKGKILLVNSDLMDLTITAMLFTLYGYTVFSAKDNTIAEKHLQSNPTDIIICDLPVTNYDGLEFIGYIRNNNLSKAPVIITSALPVEKIMPDNTLMIDYFPKPFLFEDLLDKVKEMNLLV